MGNANKRLILARRKRELEHALKDDSSKVVLYKCANKIRESALALIKKESPGFAEYRADDADVRRWQTTKDLWIGLSEEEIIKRARACPDEPALRHLS